MAEIGANGVWQKPIVATKWATGRKSKGADRAPVAILIHFATLLSIPFYRFYLHLPILPHYPIYGECRFTALTILRLPRQKLE